MTEKRFIILNEEIHRTIADTKEKKYFSLTDTDDIVNCLNKLNDENEQLKQEITQLENENERLENKLWNCRNVR